MPEDIKAKATGALVRSINPRLVAYTRPGCLAAIILTFTLTITAFIFVLQVTSAARHS